MVQSKTARELAYQILFEFERNHHRIDILESKHLKNAGITFQDRRFAKHLYSGSIRHLIYLDWIIGRLYHGHFSKLLDKVKTILRLAIYEIIYLDHVPEHATVNEYVSLTRKKINARQSALVNAVLRNYLKDPNAHNPDTEIKELKELISVKHSFPLWMIDRWIKFWGEEKTKKLCRALNEDPDFAVYLNHNKVSSEQFEKLLNDRNILFQKSCFFTEVYRMKDMQKFIHTGALTDAICTVQDESAHIPVELLDIQNGEKILDMCAAPGGKFVQILQKNKSSIAIAVDNDKTRIQIVKENMKRLNLTNGFLVVADARRLPFKPIFDKILLDAPCSGLGVIRKHPDIKWRRKEAEIQSFGKLQTELAEESIGYIKKEGKLVYSTCSIDPLENETVTGYLLDKHQDEIMQLEPPESFASLQNDKNIRTFPEVNFMDGSYCAIFKKN